MEGATEGAILKKNFGDLQTKEKKEERKT